MTENVQSSESKKSRVITALIPQERTTADKALQSLFSIASDIYSGHAEEISNVKISLDNEEVRLRHSYHPEFVIAAETRARVTADMIDTVIEEVVFTCKDLERSVDYPRFLMVQIDLPDGVINRVWVGHIVGDHVHADSLPVIRQFNAEEMRQRSGQDQEFGSYRHSLRAAVRLYQIHGDLANRLIDQLRYNPDSGLTLAHRVDPEVLYSDLLALSTPTS